MRRVFRFRTIIIALCCTAALFLTGVAAIWSEVLGGSKVYSQPSDAMVPAVLPGDRFVVDRSPKDYAVGDLVVFERPPSGLLLRRIVRTAGAEVFVDADNARFQRELSVGVSELKGRACYIVYSVEPGSLSVRTDRFFKNLSPQ